MSRPSKKTSQLQISICFSETETSFSSSAITTWFVRASRILGSFPPRYSHFLSGESEGCSSAGDGDSCALEKTQVIVHATITANVKNNLIVPLRAPFSTADAL